MGRPALARRGNLRSAPANMMSAQLHPGVISEYLSKELAHGCMLGPFPPSFSTPKLQRQEHYKGLLVIEQRSCYKVIVRRSVETPKFSFITTIQNVSVITYAPEWGVSINRNIPRGSC